MELNRFNTKDPAEKGAFMHLRHPVLQHLMYAEGPNVDENGLWDGEGDEPEKVGLTVKGAEAPSLKKYLQGLRKRSLKTRKEGSDEEEGLKFVYRTVMKFHNITSDGRPLDANNESDVELFFSQSSDLVLQVTQFSGEALNFFSAVKTT